MIAYRYNIIMSNMKQTWRETLAKGKQKTRAAVDWISVLLVCLFPIITGIIFFRLLQMTGVPNWFYILQGVFFAGSLAQAIYFFASGLLRAVRRKPVRKKDG